MPKPPTFCQCGRKIRGRHERCRACYEQRDGQPWVFDGWAYAEIRKQKEAALVGSHIPHVWERGDEAEDAISPWDV